MYLIHNTHGIVKFKRTIGNRLICEFNNVIILTLKDELSAIDFSVSEKEICKIIDSQKCDSVSTWNKHYKSYTELYSSTDIKDWAKLIGLIESLNKDLSFGERKLLSQAKDRINLYLTLQKAEVKHNDAV